MELAEATKEKLKMTKKHKKLVLAGAGKSYFFDNKSEKESCVTMYAVTYREAKNGAEWKNATDETTKRRFEILFHEHKAVAAATCDKVKIKENDTIELKRKPLKGLLFVAWRCAGEKDEDLHVLIFDSSDAKGRLIQMCFRGVDVAYIQSQVKQAVGHMSMAAGLSVQEATEHCLLGVFNE